MTLISLLAHVDMCVRTTPVVESQTSKFGAKQVMQIKSAKCAKTFCTDYYTMQTNPQRVDLLFRGMFYQEEHSKRLMQLASSGGMAPMKQIAITKNFMELTHSGAYYHGLAPKDLFEIPDDKSSPTGKKVMHYTLKKGCAPSHALERVLNLQKGEVFFVDCLVICQISAYKMIQETIPDKFDDLFGSDSPVPLSLGRDSAVMKVFLTTIPANKVDKIEVGDWVSFGNIDRYQWKHFNGSALGMNTVCVSTTPTFTGLGLDPKGVTQEEIEKLLLEEYNKAPVPMIGMPESVKKSQERLASSCRVLQSDTIPTIEEFRAQGGGRRVGVTKINFERIERLADSSIEEGVQLLTQWQKELQT